MRRNLRSKVEGIYRSSINKVKESSSVQKKIKSIKEVFKILLISTISSYGVHSCVKSEGSESCSMQSCSNDSENNLNSKDISKRKTNNIKLICEDHSHNIKIMEENLNKEQENDLKRLVAHTKKNRKRYEYVANKTNIPWKLIACIHYREDSDMNTNTYLHNGERLGKRTKKHPKGKLFKTWEDAAIDALNARDKKRTQNELKITKKTKDIPALYAYAERYNGVGYRMYMNNVSPYVYSGTNMYKSGKYIADNKYSKDTIDKQLGVAVCLNVLENE